MGRDQLFDLLRFHGLLIRTRKRMIRTTNSNHWLKRYHNLIKQMCVTDPEQLWVSDITYIRTLQGFSYLSLILMYTQEKLSVLTIMILWRPVVVNALKMTIENMN